MEISGVRNRVHILVPAAPSEVSIRFREDLVCHSAVIVKAAKKTAETVHGHHKLRYAEESELL